ncbi:hypothetical protein [Thiocystis violascens]|uniref:Uncharacterized protein n=1 Tax=Thiocystis violascens (strain ATCC 17096 / DSM 198 / 6111) TaxID=765911 RepID=I3YC48_THIV6|nr:hypothetical protein [Thiocystis violascens]AFL74566.1 hypothetical protein Thivi_2633 [Thiocystis violascens DSM 198]
MQAVISPELRQVLERFSSESMPLTLDTMLMEANQWRGNHPQFAEQIDALIQAIIDSGLPCRDGPSEPGPCPDPPRVYRVVNKGGWLG